MSRNEQLCWFHGKLTRENAEELIKNEGKEDGVFLVRESNSAAGDFVLTLLYKDEVCHYQIRRHGEDAFFSIDDKVKIVHGLETLVEFYQQNDNGLVTKLTTYVKKDPPPNDARRHGTTNLLHRATKENNHTVVSELLKCGYRSVDAKNQDGQTAVHLAAQHCDEVILKLLLDAGVNVNCMDTSGYMPLHYACRNKPASFIRTLIEAHANVQGRNIKNGYVPLHEAAKHGNLEAVKELLTAHAPLLPRTSYGEFPIDLAKEANKEDVIAFLDSFKTPSASTFKSLWYHGTLNREEAVKTLMEFAAQMKNEHSTQLQSATVKDADTLTDELASTVNNDLSSNKVPDTSGCFLVRFSQRSTAGSGYVLTLLWNNNVKNFIISQSSNYLYIDDGPYLPSLEHLVEHFMRFTDGLPVSLKHPVKPKPKPPLPLFSTMPRHQKRAAVALLSPTTEQNRIPLDEQQSLVQNAAAADRKHTQTLNTKKKHKENSGSVLHSLRLRSPKKSSIIDSVNSLRKNKNKHKQQPQQQESTHDTQKASSIDNLNVTAPHLMNLCFSTEFSNLQLGSEAAAANTSTATDYGLSTASAKDTFYNVPKNNAAIAGDDAAVNVTSAVPAFEMESKTEAEVEYFTKSDVAIERERMYGEAQQPLKFATNANGYVPTVDIRVFLDSGPLAADYSPEALEASAAELREFSIHPERLDSHFSITSMDSEVLRCFNRQISTASDGSGATAVASQSKLSYFITRNCLELDAIIGVGEFGSVYKGRLLRRVAGNEASAEVRCEVAIKTLRDEHCRTNKQEFLREASVMIRLQHHCIVQLIGISKGETLMMVQELVPLGSMLNFILEHRERINPNYELKLWASQIACGMQYLESHHFVHRDLAARNILLASRNQAKISDFGLSRALATDNDCYEASQGGKWPIKWYAPESFNNGFFSHASDVWSFGVTLWEMFSLGDPPYGDKRGVDAIAFIESGQRLSQPTLCPLHVYEIMKNCWNYKPKDRPTFRYLTDFFANDPDYQNIMELIKTEHIS